MPILEMDRAGRVFGSREARVVALDDVSLRVEHGEFLAIMGPSGSGKSTLLHLAGGLDRPTSGRVLLNGRDLASLSAAELTLALRRQVGFVFQGLNLLPTLTAAENVALPLELDGVRPRAAMSSATGLLESVGLRSVANPAVWRRTAAGGDRPGGRRRPGGAARRRAHRGARLDQR